MVSDNEGCRLGIIQPDFVTRGNPYADSGNKFITSFFPSHLNCSYVGLDVRNIESSLNESGMYDTDSAYGALQDNRINIFAYFVSLKSFENPSVFKVDVPVVGAEAVLLNAVSLVNDTNIDILETFNTFQVDTYYLTLVVLCLTIGSLKWIMKWSVWKSIWACITGFLGQGNDDGETIPQRIIWLFFQFFIFFAVLGYWGGLISAEMTVSWTPRRIERLEDIFDPHFNATPFFFKQVPVYSLLYYSPSGSIQKEILKRAEERRSVIDSSILAEHMEDSPAILDKFLDSLSNPNEAYLDYDLFAESILRVACFARNIKEPIFARGTESFGSDTFVFPYSSQLPNKIRHKANKHLRREFQAGLFNVKFRKLVSSHMEMSTFAKETVVNMKCSSLNFFKEKEKYNKLNPSSPSPVSLLSFIRLLDVMCILVCVCQVVYIIEWVVYLMNPWFFN